MAIPDTPALLITWLETQALGPTFGAKLPDPIPDDYVQIRRIGGPALPPVRDQPLIQFSSWAATGQLAMDMLHTLRPLLFALVGTATLGPVVYDVAEQAGPTSTTDPQTGRPWAFMRTSITIRADELTHQFSGAI